MAKSTPAASFRNVEVAAAANALSVVGALVERLRAADQRAMDLAAQLEQATQDLNNLQLKEIPDAMEAVGLTSFTLNDGSGAILEVKDDVKANISKDKQADAFAWLREHGHGGSVRQQLVVDMSGIDESIAEDIRGAVDHAGATAVEQDTIHPMTLKSLVKEMLENGQEPPPSISVFQFKKAVLKVKKGK